MSTSVPNHSLHRTPIYNETHVFVKDFLIKLYLFDHIVTMSTNCDPYYICFHLTILTSEGITLVKE